MGLFGNLFNPKKWTLGTLGDLAGLAGGAITGGALPGSQALGLGLSALGGLAGSNSGGNVPQTYTPGTTEQLLDMLGQGDLKFALANQGKRHSMLNQAANALDPKNNAANAGYFSNQLMRNADLAGRRNANDLRRRGYSSGVGDAAMLDARNQATTQGNEYFASLTNPMAMAQRYGAMADLYGNMGLFQNSLSGKMMIQNQANQQRLFDLDYYNNKPASGLESILGIASQFAPYMGGLFGSKSSGTPTSSSSVRNRAQEMKDFGTRKGGGLIV